MRGPHPQSHETLRYRGHVTNTKRYISTFTRPVHLKLRRVVTQDEGTPPTKSRDTSTAWSCDNSKTLYLHFHKAFGSQTQQDNGYSVFITIEVCAEGNSVIQVSAYFYPSLPNKYNISNVKEAVGMQRKLSENKRKNADQN